SKVSCANQTVGDRVGMPPSCLLRPKMEVSVIKLVIHSTGVGHCVLTGKEAEGFVVTFEDGTVAEGFLSHKALVQLVRMKLPVRQERSSGANGVAAKGGAA